MALAATDAHGFTRCERCGRKFKNEHHCRASLGEYMPRRPEGFEALVEEYAQEHRAEQTAGEQLSLTDVASCVRCGPTDKHVDDDTGLCTTCMASDAKELAARVAGYYADTRSRRAPP